ncbi:tetratricopeptide repeat protein [Synechococcus sp. FACHB-909]|uniref:O-linked N-acetylglucosamine transferase, SPINDLY family protein n=1 Tax=Synechococcus sp. FACHB-909 TaxID=2692863 RepID=UPI00168786C9|nr:tetratricopeptide repeat protein [Synechococcus sp. FACHB-909]MBD2718884.1 tetratricopeptide repeat protein [Synechococcus sp. FACHB-909]
MRPSKDSLDDLHASGPTPSADPQTFYDCARRHFLAGSYGEAITALSRILSDERFSVRASSNIGSCLLMMNHVRAATRYIDRALQQDPNYIPALLNRVKALQAQQQHEESQIVCQQILRDDPTDEAAWEHWVRSLLHTQQREPALQVVKRWQAQLPDSFLAQMTEGELLYQQGAFEDAIRPFGQALRINPAAEKVYAHLSVVMMMLYRHDAALDYIDKALAIQAESVRNRSRKAQILWLMGRWEEASDWFGKAFSLSPQSANLFLNQHLCLPGIPESRDEIEKARVRFVRGLVCAEEDRTLELDFLDEAVPHTFTLTYHNQQDRAVLERYVDVMRKLARPLFSQFLEEENDSERGATNGLARDRLRIGFLSQFFTGHSNALAFEGLIRNLDRRRFEVILIHTAHARKDQSRDSLDAAAERVIHLPDDLVASAGTLRNLDLDILFFTDIGMNPYSHLLPLFKTAPIQLTGWGVPHTSGIREIDYYVSADDLEPTGSEASYTESLVRLPGGLPCCFSLPDVELIPVPREYFFLPPEHTLVGCLQSLHKLHPDFDDVLEQIAQQNPEVVFVFVEDTIEARTAAFLARLSRTAPSVRARCVTLASMRREDYHALCHCIDLLLDPIYYGCGITFFEASFAGTPILTLEGHNLRSRVVACGYREMGIEDPPIATSPEGYVMLASQLINDPARRDRIRESIRLSNQRIFNRLDYVRNFEAFCLQAAQSRRHSLAQPALNALDTANMV